MKVLGVPGEAGIMEKGSTMALRILARATRRVKIMIVRVDVRKEDAEIHC